MIPNLRRFLASVVPTWTPHRNRPRRWRNWPQCRREPPDALRTYLHGGYVMMYTAVEASATVYLLSIRHHRQLSFDFAGLWNRE
ncbi:hypothetical protein [Xanthomonas sacchari]|uniref:hypothetical protein n=1 Tax=Xanthomonas sacchari TaxID=56458 RepID=UPI00299F57FD|nr:hypothetical protein [Xanthomonas sacchari]